MLRLYAGRENIDKERFIYDRIRESGGETFVLVPDQYTLVAEEQALKYLDTDCLFDTEILSMNRLGLRVLSEQGTESVRMLDKYGRFMLLSMLIKEHASDFEIFARMAGRISFTSMLNDFISEFKQQDCSLEKMRELMEGAGDDPVTSAKLRELSGVISAYEEAIGGIYTDSEDYISMYVAAIKDSKLVRGRNIWIYGYDSITPKFADAVLRLADAAESVSFIVNRSDFRLDEYLVSSLTAAAKERNLEVSCEEISAAYVYPKSETIKRIEKYLCKDVLRREERTLNADFVPEDLTLVCAANPYYEAESAAAYISHLVRDLGYRMRDIQVVANDEDCMQPIIRRVFAEYGLPLFADRPRDITDSAAVSFIVELLNFVRWHGRAQHLFAMLKTGLTDFDAQDIEDLENYARDYRIKGSMWDRPFRYGQDDMSEESFGVLESMRQRISDSAARLAAAAAEAPDVSSFIRSFRKYLDEDWDLGGRILEAAEAQEALGLRDEAQRMTQSVEKAIDILDQIDKVMGGSEMELSEFIDIYTAGLSDVEVGVIPPAMDGLSVGTLIRTRPGQIRAAVILGANEGVLPLSPSTEGLFSVDEKEYFRKMGFALGRLDDIKADEEKAAMYRMMAKPSEKLYISYAMSDAQGGDAEPSAVIDSLKTLFPRIESDGLIKKDIISAGWGSTQLFGRDGQNSAAADKPEPAYSHEPAVSDVISSADDGMRHLINRIKDRNAPDEPDSLTKAMLRWYADKQKDRLDSMLRAASYLNDPKPLGRDLAKKLFGRKDGTLGLSASSIGSYIDCPFRYYIDKGLKPKEERVFASDSRAVGDVYHECLMAVARQIMSDRELLDRLRGGDTADLEDMVQAALDELAETYRGGLFISAGSEDFRMSRIREICAGAAKAMALQLSSGTLVDAVFEEGFGRGGRFAPVSFRLGDDEVLVEGRIDRTDIIDVDGEKRVRIVDYKTGSDRLDLRKMRSGIKMQLMIYLISASTGGPEPAGMFYFNIKDPLEGVNDKSASAAQSIAGREAQDEFKLRGTFINEDGVLAAMPESVLASAKNCITREEYEEARSDVVKRIEETASGILSGRIGINPLKNDGRLVCSYCGYKAVCRRDRGYVRNAARTIPAKS